MLQDLLNPKKKKQKILNVFAFVVRWDQRRIESFGTVSQEALIAGV